VRKIKSK